MAEHEHDDATKETYEGTGIVNGNTVNYYRCASCGKQWHQTVDKESTDEATKHWYTR
jgi:hypothetical protein